MTDEQLARLLLLSTRYDSAVSWAEICEREHERQGNTASREAWVRANAQVILTRTHCLDYVRGLHRELRPAETHPSATPDGSDRRS